MEEAIRVAVEDALEAAVEDSLAEQAVVREQELADAEADRQTVDQMISSQFAADLSAVQQENQNEINRLEQERLQAKRSSEEQNSSDAARIAELERMQEQLQKSLANAQLEAELRGKAMLDAQEEAQTEELLRVQAETQAAQA